MQSAELQKHLKFNVIVNLIDGGFFGFALGFASFVTVIPLFVSTMTSSALLIGLIPAIHSVGWQLPQLFIVNQVASQRRYKPLVLLLTLNERLPFLGLAVVAWLLPTLGKDAALLLTFLLLVWQGLGGGFTAAAWQAMIAKIIPGERRGTFYGGQSSVANLMASLGAVLAGLILARLGNLSGFAACFLLAVACMVPSWFFLAQTREPECEPVPLAEAGQSLAARLRLILRSDVNFRWFLLVRLLSQPAVLGFSFYTVYAVRRHGLDDFGVGLMTAIFMGAQIVANPLLGWLGDHWSHRGAMSIGALCAIASSLLAWWAPGPAWFYLAYLLAGIANVATWTVPLAMLLEFGEAADRPAYIGLANTLVAPMTILAPLVGGLLADASGYPAAFLAAAAGGGLMLLALQVGLRDIKAAALMSN